MNARVEATTLLERLEATLTRTASLVVAFSGGVDSSVVAAVAAQIHGSRALAVTAVSPALATGELDAAAATAEAIGIAHETVTTDELSKSGYRANGPDRCYHCKTTLYEQLALIASARGFAAVASGTNVDDLGDWRPGLIAASEHAVVHPLVDAGIDKHGVRAIARLLDVPSADKVASPCLASRVPYGTGVTAAVLGQIDRAEAAVRMLGVKEFRVRHLGSTARLEVAADELESALAAERRHALIAAMLGAGYARADVSEVALRSGSLNDRLSLGV